MAEMRAGLAIASLGVVVALASVLADPLGVGGQPGFGWKQLIGVLVGAALLVVGVVRARMSSG